MRHQKTTSLILFTCSLLALIVLAASLSNLTLKPGIGFQASEDGVLPDRTFETIIPEESGILIFIQGFLALVFLAFLILLVIRLAVNVNFKLVGAVSLVLILLVGVSYLLPETNPRQAFLPGADNPISIEATSAPDTSTPTDQSPQALFWIIVILVTIGLGIMLFNLIRAWLSSPKPESELIRSAEQALNALNSGMELKNVILRCYYQMTSILLEEQGIEREAAMTVWEFKDRLEQKGYPSDTVSQLTSLFEKIRYGQQEIKPEDEDIALTSLNEIIAFAKRNGERRQ